MSLEKKVEVINYYRQLASKLKESLFLEIKDLSHQITTSSMNNKNWFLELRKTAMTTKDFYHLCLAFGDLSYDVSHELVELPPEELETFIFTFYYMQDEFEKSSKKFINTKFYNFFWRIFKRHFAVIYRYKIEWFPPIREFSNNFEYKSREDIRRLMKRTIKVGVSTPRRAKRAQFIRGYRDHGSRPSDEEIARKLAAREYVDEVRFYKLLDLSRRYKDPQAFLAKFYLRE